MLVAMGVSLTSLTFGFQAVANGGMRNGMPAFPFFMFGIVALLGFAGDLRMIRSGVPPRGGARIARHLWRMCFALFIAAMSFFIGQADEFPEALRIPLLLAVPVLAPVVSMAYWLWRVRSRPSVRELVIARAPAGASLA
jgi:peptidoglycan/LPS O-acetylase OafA/YrhL